ncbi:hypothetical protein BIY26_22385 [Brenneria goodwinii]|uniref:Uncharacterized protein n=1 Tax=Brenneria goodwinii TaxID=1109412 RepID=A0AAE8EMA3_9GAMM|nr:hypothetical protein BIY26_22385 [Brenneria goodwinii]
MFFLLSVRITPLNRFFLWIDRYGRTIGVIVLTIGVMVPIASGKISASTCVLYISEAADE